MRRKLDLLNSPSPGQAFISNINYPEKQLHVHMPNSSRRVCGVGPNGPGHKL